MQGTCECIPDPNLKCKLFLNKKECETAICAAGDCR